MCNLAPSITHMLFADDSYLYCKANETKVDHILRLLQVFEWALGKKKTLINQSSCLVRILLRALGFGYVKRLNMEEAGAVCKYLGLKNMMKRSKVVTMGYLRGKMKK